MSNSMEPMNAAKPRRRFGKGALLASALAVFSFILASRYREVAAERQRLAARAAPSEPLGLASTPAVAALRGEATSWTPRVSISGTLLPVREATLSFKVPGRLAAVRAKVGDRVGARQNLAELDDAEPRAAHAAALAQVHAAEVRVAIAREDERASRMLLEQGAIPAVQHTVDRQRLDSASAELDAVRAQAQTLAVALESTLLDAPFSGRVTAAPSAPGAIVMPGVELFRIEDTSALRLTATVSAADAVFARPGMEVELEGGQRGRVSAVLPSVDPQTRRLPILAEFTNAGPRPLLANLFVRATLVPKEPISVLKLPASALRPGSQDELVRVAGDRLALVRVVFSRASDGSLLVRDGLSPEDRVLAAPGAQVQDGDAAPLMLSEVSR